MVGLEGIFKAGYAIMIIAIALMAWVVYTSAEDFCPFDPECRCSGYNHNLGEVVCRNTPVYMRQFNSSQIYTLSLINNQLNQLDPNVLSYTGVTKLEIIDNPIYVLHEDSFDGLERSLWELRISNCKLAAIPGGAIKHLLKLRILDLSDNEIIEINVDQLKGVAASLKTLILRDNSLTVLPAGVFAVLSVLETLDLSGNSISTLDPAVFTPPPPMLSKLNLSDNLFEEIPYKQLSGIRTLRIVDLSYNNIKTIRAGPAAGKLNLDQLILDYNSITQINSLEMSHFDVANRTSFVSNPITLLEANAFRGCRIRELYLTNCKLTNIDPEAFNGLEMTLETLDLSGNNITAFSIAFLKNQKYLTALFLDFNFISNINWIIDERNEKAIEEMMLTHFSFEGTTNSPFNLKIVPRFKNLHILEMSRPFQSSLTADDFAQFTVEMDTLRITNGGVTSLAAHVFKHTRGIKHLDLTDNNIEKIEAKTFSDLGHSLESLTLTHALSSSYAKFPKNVFKPLTALRTLKINHNQLKSLPQDINTLKLLCFLYAQDNIIDDLPKDIFKGNMQLREIDLSFNRISKIRKETFTHLEKLKRLDLEDNVISYIETGSFADMTDLSQVFLRGNKISKIDPEAMQSVPHLSDLDLAYNSLKSLHLFAFDQVGNFKTLILNASHNSIHVLDLNSSGISHADIGMSFIKVLDLSWNNMTTMSVEYLKPLENSLTHLYLSHNSLSNITLSELPHIRFLDFSYNIISDLTYEALRMVPHLQVLLMPHNKLTEIQRRLFAILPDLTRADFSHNQIVNIMDSAFTSTKLTALDLSHNLLSRVPVNALSPASASRLLELDLSHNLIAMLPTSDSFSRFFSLRKLNLAYNRLTELGGSLYSLPKLINLDLSDNPLHIGADDFNALDKSLLHLDLSNTTISYVPALPLSLLLTLKMGQNGLTFIPPETATNMTNLKDLDVSLNPLQSIPSFPQLKHLNLAETQILSVVKNGSFKDFLVLQELNLQKMPLTEFDMEALSELTTLKKLHLSNFKQVTNFNIPKWVSQCYSLRELHLTVAGAPTLGIEMKGKLPRKVRSLVLSGGEMKAIPDHILNGLQYPSVSITIRNTSVDSISQSIFSSLNDVRNISLYLYNNSMKYLGNPSNVGQLNTPKKLFLVDFSMRNNLWTCDCDLGWLETWQRKMRQYFPKKDFSQDAREAKCKNKQNKPVLNILKSELECGWSSATTSHVTLSLIILPVFYYLLR